MKLQQQKNQYTLTIPKNYVTGFGWHKHIELTFEIIGKGELKIKKKE